VKQYEGRDMEELVSLAEEEYAGELFPRWVVPDPWSFKQFEQ
jgi:hypothetical protein